MKTIIQFLLPPWNNAASNPSRPIGDSNRRILDAGVLSGFLFTRIPIFWQANTPGELEEQCLGITQNYDNHHCEGDGLEGNYIMYATKWV